MSGRGLGYTGGTIDKLESIKGYRIDLTDKEILKQVKDINIVLTGQTASLVPMDKVIHALRDVTATVSSIPLIASSIMSKKIASGADKILIDIKVGNGALLQTKEEAEKLSELMIKIGDVYHREVRTIISDMNTPLGRCIGNGLEVLEAIRVLKGEEKDTNLVRLCHELASWMVSMGLNISFEEASQKVHDSVQSGMAYQKFLELVKYQGGDINNISLSDTIYPLKAKKSGTVKKIDALELGKLSLMLGAGKIRMDDTIDYGVGIELLKLVGDTVKKGDVLANLYITHKPPVVDLDKFFTIQ